MARLDGDSRELYEGEREAMIRRIQASRRHLSSVDVVRNRYDMAVRFAKPEDDFRLSTVREVQRHSTGFKIVYSSRGFFRG